MTAQLFAMHSDNLRAVADALERILSIGREAIRDEDAEAERDLTLASALLLGTKLEVRLAKVLHEPGGFSLHEYKEILGQRRQDDRWTLAIDVGFRRRYNTWYLDDHSIGQEAASRRETLQSAFASHLEPIIRMRNSLAHGQWVHPLNSKESAKNTDMACLIAEESILSLSIKDRLAHHYCQLLGDLVSTEFAFERDFRKTYAKFLDTLDNLIRSDIGEYRIQLVDRHRRGLEQRRAGHASGVA